MVRELTAVTSRKVTVTLPKSLLARLDAMVPRRQRSRFIAEAIQEQIAMLEQAEAIEEAAGSWTDEKYPELLTTEDIDNWLKALRGNWEPEDVFDE